MNPILLTTSQQKPILRLDLTPSVASSARELFDAAAQAFQHGVEETINFDPGHRLDGDECFQIRDFLLDPAILTACHQPLSVDRLQANEIGNLPVKSIIGYDFDNNEERIYFQNFDSRRVIIPGNRLAIFSAPDSSTFQELQSPVILLNAELAATWHNGVLSFKSFSLARRIFDLSAYFQAATDEQVTQFATNSRFTSDAPEALLGACTEWHRKKIALILRSGDLDRFTTEVLIAAGQSVGYQVPLDGERIRLPLEKKELRQLLQFLDEDIYRGPFSQRQLISSGKRVGNAP